MSYDFIVLLIIFITMIVIMMIVNANARRVMKKYNNYFSHNITQTGGEFVRNLLTKNGYSPQHIRKLKNPSNVYSHYNIEDNKILLSPLYYNSPSISSQIISLHEGMHFLQSNKDTKLFSNTIIARRIARHLFIICTVLVMFCIFSIFFNVLVEYTDLALCIIWACYTMGAMFPITSVMIEYNASKNALSYMEKYSDSKTLHKANDYDMKYYKKVLFAAGATYVVQMIFYILAAVLLFICIYIIATEAVMVPTPDISHLVLSQDPFAVWNV